MPESQAPLESFSVTTRSAGQKTHQKIPLSEFGNSCGKIEKIRIALQIDELAVAS
jgi:hypothetical protein